MHLNQSFCDNFIYVIYSSWLYMNAGSKCIWLIYYFILWWNSATNIATVHSCHEYKFISGRQYHMAKSNNNDKMKSEKISLRIWTLTNDFFFRFNQVMINRYEVCCLDWADQLTFYLFFVSLSAFWLIRPSLFEQNI